MPGRDATGRLGAAPAGAIPGTAPLRVAVFSDSYAPYVSGVVRFIELTRAELRRRGHRVAVFGPAYPGPGGGAPPGPGALAEAPWPDADDVYRFPSLPAPRYPQFRVPVPWGPRLQERLAALAPDVVHLHSPFVLGRLGLRAARRLGVPVCLTFHTQYDVYLERYAGPAAAALRPALLGTLRRFAGACDLVIAPTRAVRSRLERLGVSTRIEVLTGGIPVDRFAAGDGRAVRRDWGVPDSCRVLLYVGRLSAEKNLGVLVGAFERLAAARADVCLVMVGDGPLRPALARRAAALGERRLLLPGAVAYERLPDVLAAADAFLFPSRSETQALAVLEALAAGLPVVAARSPEMEEVLGDAGLVVDPDPGGMAAACARLLDDPALARELAERARRRAQRYALTAVVDRMLELYGELRSAPRAGTAV